MNYYKKHYIQFNDLVFENAEESNPSVSFRDFLTPYTYRAGSYLARPGIAEAGRASLSVTFSLKKLPCEVRDFYRDFVTGQLKDSGKLWAVQGNDLVWAYADRASISEDMDAKKGTFGFDIEFNLPEGIWHKADPKKTFLRPWDACSFMDCHDFHKIPCEPLEGECCTKCGTPLTIGCDCCECDNLDKEMALCYNTDKLRGFYGCDREYQVVYSCEAAERFFTEHGQKICGDCGTIAGNYYSDTTEDTTEITIAFDGEVTNPHIEINGNGNIIRGTYTNLTIYPDGTAVDCSGCEVDVNNWVVPQGNEYGWTIHQGNNRVIIDTGNCCGMVCAYISASALTI